ncbi:hypothetical protein VNO78_10611 [Psophocarpus tetragonolobus]|uniref:Uncharacterized protein n=1 Tax=Psophocarpus tetragonolobus TaxID=3891 RepID=A0AAN9XMX2_PSOTE
MAETACSSSWCKNKVDDELMISEWSEVDAAQKLMQLSDEEEIINIKGTKRSRNVAKHERLSDIIMAKIQEIFGSDIESFPMKKQRRYRSLVSIYMVTRPVNVGSATRVNA